MPTLLFEPVALDDELEEVDGIPDWVCRCCDESDGPICDGCDCCQECCNCTPTDCDCDACAQRRELDDC